MLPLHAVPGLPLELERPAPILSFHVVPDFPLCRPAVAADKALVCSRKLELDRRGAEVVSDMIGGRRAGNNRQALVESPVQQDLVRVRVMVRVRG